MGKELKNNIRSFRYSDRVSEILEGMEGKTLNEKFENLVLTCHVILPDIQRKIGYESKRLEQMRADWWELWGLKSKVEKKLGCIDRLAAELDEIVAKSEELLSSRKDDM